MIFKLNAWKKGERKEYIVDLIANCKSCFEMTFKNLNLTFSFMLMITIIHKEKSLDVWKISFTLSLIELFYNDM